MNQTRQTPNFESGVKSVQTQPRGYLSERREGGLQIRLTDWLQGRISRDLGNALLTVEYAFANSPKGDFNLIFGKIAFTKAGRFIPCLGADYWRDGAKELGAFNSLQLGLAYKFSSHFSLEASCSRSDN